MDQKTITEKFFTDPDWQVVEALVESYLEELKDLGTVDTSQPSDAIAAEVKGRQIARASMQKFLEGARILSRKHGAPQSPSPFR